MRARVVVGGLGLWWAACSGAPAPPPQHAPAPAGAEPASPAIDAAAASDAGPPADWLPFGEISETAVMKDVDWLCDPARSGRGSYQRGGRAAAAYVEQEFRAAGLDVSRQRIRRGAVNVIGIRRGGPQAVVVAAHYDHIGRNEDGAIHPGADDNASGTAALLAIARLLAGTRGGHTLVFIGFGAEEDRLRGSNRYVHAPSWPLERTAFMVNFDMIGRNLFEFLGEGLPGRVGVVGLEASERARQVAERAAAREGMQLMSASGQMLERFGMDARTDDWWFRRYGVATVHFSTGLHGDYHRMTDTVDKLRPAQIARIARLAARLVAELAELTPTDALGDRQAQDSE